MSNDPRIAAASENFAAWWRFLASRSAEGEVWQFDDLLAVTTGVAGRQPHGAMANDRLADAEAVLGAAFAEFRERRLPRVALIRDGADPAAVAYCERAGLRAVHNLPAMAMDIPPRSPLAPAALRIARDETEDDFRRHAELDAAAFEGSVEDARAIFVPELIGEPAFRALTGSVAGVPVACAMVLATGATAGIYGVGAVRAHRGRGYGTAMTYAAMREGAAMGCTIATLQTTAAARSMYERAGFRVMFNYLVYEG